MDARPTTTGRSIDELTAKQVAVLELLTGHMTGKEIARALGITPNTVEKHLKAVRARWGTGNRQETARVYRELRDGGQKIPPQILADDDLRNLPPMAGQGLPSSAEFRLADVFAFDDARFRDSAAPPGLEELDRRFGKVWRAGAILVSAVIIGMIAIWGLAFARTLSDIV